VAGFGAAAESHQEPGFMGYRLAQATECDTAVGVDSEETGGSSSVSGGISDAVGRSAAAIAERAWNPSRFCEGNAAFPAARDRSEYGGKPGILDFSGGSGAVGGLADCAVFTGRITVPNTVRHIYWIDKIVSRCSSVIG